MKFDERLRMDRYNTEDTAINNDFELLKASNMCRNKLIFCRKFIVSKESIESIKRNGNFVIGIE